MKKIKLTTIVFLLTFASSKSNICQGVSEGESEIENLEAQKSSLTATHDDYINGKKLIGEYYVLVNKAIEEDKPELLIWLLLKLNRLRLY